MHFLRQIWREKAHSCPICFIDGRRFAHHTPHTHGYLLRDRNMMVKRMGSSKERQMRLSVFLRKITEFNKIFSLKLNLANTKKHFRNNLQNKTLSFFNLEKAIK